MVDHIHEIKCSNFFLPLLVWQEGVVDKSLLSTGEEGTSFSQKIVLQENVSEVAFGGAKASLDDRINFSPNGGGWELFVLPLSGKSVVELLFEDFERYFKFQSHISLGG